jgi:hypothetical protein
MKKISQLFLFAILPVILPIGNISAQDIEFSREYLGVPIADAMRGENFLITGKYYFYLEWDFNAEFPATVYRTNRDTLITKPILQGNISSILTDGNYLFYTQGEVLGNPEGMYRVDFNGENLRKIHEVIHFDLPFFHWGHFYISSQSNGRYRLPLEGGKTVSLPDTYIYRPVSFGEEIIGWIKYGDDLGLCRLDMDYDVKEAFFISSTAGEFYYTQDKLFLSDQESGIIEIDVATGENRTLSADTASGPLALYGDHLYYSRDDDGLRLNKLDIKTGESIPLNSEYNNTIISCDDEYLYYFHGESPGGDNTRYTGKYASYLGRYAFDLSRNRERFFPHRKVRGVCVVDNTLYFTLPRESDFIYAVDLTSKKITQLLKDQTAYPLFHMAGDVLYLSSPSINEYYLMLYDRDSDRSSRLAHCGRRVLFDNGWIYFLNADEQGMLYKRRVSDGQVRRVTDYPLTDFRVRDGEIYGFVQTGSNLFDMFAIDPKGNKTPLVRSINDNFPEAVFLSGKLFYVDGSTITSYDPKLKKKEVVHALEEGYVSQLISSRKRLYYCYDVLVREGIRSIRPDGSGLRVHLDKEVFNVYVRNGYLYYMYDEGDTHEETGRDSRLSFPYRLRVE